MLTVCAGSSVDQQSNNVTLFNLVEQINLNPGMPPPPNGIVPVEIHAYWRLASTEIGHRFEARFVLVGPSGLETPSETLEHRSVTERLRTRTLGLPFPPVLGTYDLRVDWRITSDQDWRREALEWPVGFVEAQPAPKVTH